jgi:hypothetical protein
VSGCATNVSVDYDKTVVFSQLKSYSLLPKSPASTEDKRLSSPLIDERIVKAIKASMAAKGYRYTDTGQDMKLVYQLDLKQEITTDGSGVTMVIGSGGGRAGFGLAYSIPTGEVRSYDRGRLTIDVMSADGKKLLWRGTSSRRIYEASTPADSDELVNDIVSEILEEFPPQP